MRYNYKQDKDEFVFLQLPRSLKEKRGVKPELKYLYTLMYDTTKQSMENQWFDENGDVYIYMGIDTIMKEMECANQKAIKMKRELVKLGLIEEVRQGLNKPNRIYVHKIQ